jgi:hypothetical protein
MRISPPISPRPAALPFSLLLFTFRSLLLTVLLSLPAAALKGQSTAVEDCNNGVDDDGDGLIDCYDQDCTCTGQCDDFYYTTCNADCYYIPPCGQITLGVQWTSTAETGTYSPIVAGDMDNDGVPEVVTYRVENADIYILDGATGATKVHIIAPTVFVGGTAPAIADLDNDGYGELVIVGNDQRMYCYEHDGTLKYVSGLVGYDSRYRWSVPNIADFDHDGMPEVNIGNQVFNGQTGALLASGGPSLSAGEHPARRANGFSFNSTVAIDALPDNFCADCDGLEIVAGNQVLSVNLVTGAVNMIVQAAGTYTDGFTSVVDFDRDGDLDAIVQGKRGNLNYVYCWEIESPVIMRQFKLFNNWGEGASRVNVADLNGDGQLEISFVGFPYLYALRNNFTPMWTRATDDASSITCSSVFDFCGDGSADVIYRGSSFLQVLNGADGQVSWEDDCVSATHIENPLVLDVDADGQTEIVIQCGTNGSVDSGHVVVYEAVGLPGIASRKVWNQHAYFNTNINDDLSVPRRQQNHHIIGDSLKMNTFLNQFFNPTFPSPDAVLTLDQTVCEGDSIALTLTLCNIGDNLLPPQTPVSLYQGNPETTAAPWLGSFPIGFALQGDSCRTFTARLPRIANDSIFVLVNDNHSQPPPFNLANDFPTTSIGECSFTNNIAAFFLPYLPDPVALGPDTALCHNGTIVLEAGGHDLVEWEWQDGSTDSTLSVTLPGSYSVTVTDVCGLTHTDAIAIDLDSSTVVQLGPDRAICQGETVSLGESGFDTYAWSPAAAVSCAGCDSVVAGPSASGYIVLNAAFANGCQSSDSVYVAVSDTFNYVVDTTICYGRTVTWNGQTIGPDSSRIFALQTFQGCDSTVTVRVHGTTVGTYQVTVDTAVCLGQTLSINGFDLEAGESKIFNLATFTGCDSTVIVTVAPKDTFATAESRTICNGETSTVFGQPQGVSGTFRMTFPAANGCDSTHTVQLTVLDPIDIDLQPAPACAGETNGALVAVATGSAPPFDYAWNLPGATGPELQDLPAGAYSLTVSDAQDCTATATATVGSYPPIVFSVEADSVDCYGENTGGLTAASPDPALVFSLDGGVFSQQSQFDGLLAGTYELLAQDVNGCVDTLEATVLQPPQLLLQLPPDQTLNLGDSLSFQIEAGGVPPLQFLWNDTIYLSCADCPDVVIRPFDSRQYTLTVTDQNGCSTTDDLRIELTRIINVFVPNAVAPDAAEVANRLFVPSFGSAVSRVVLFQVFDRWGALVHEATNAVPNDFAMGWDGTAKGKTAMPGVYIWVMEVELADGAREKLRGDVTVVR